MSSDRPGVSDSEPPCQPGLGTEPHRHDGDIRRAQRCALPWNVSQIPFVQTSGRSNRAESTPAALLTADHCASSCEL